MTIARQIAAPTGPVLGGGLPWEISSGGSPPAPINTVAPVITGSLYAGATLTCSTGTWTLATSYAYQWKRGGVAIGGETAATHVAVLADEGTSVTCVVTATGPGGTTSADSAGVTIWSPALASNLAHWYRGDSVVTASGDLQTMTDKVVSGGVNATQGTAAQRPAYSASLPILGQPGGVYAGPTVDWLDTGAITSIPQPFSIALAAAITSDPTIQQELCGSTTGWWLDVYLGQLRVFGGTAAIDTGFYPVQNQTFRAVITINGTSTRVRVNGSLVYSGATNAGSGAAARCMIGRAAVGIYWRGEIGEVALVAGNVIADAAELAKWEGYLTTRYA